MAVDAVQRERVSVSVKHPQYGHFEYEACKRFGHRTGHSATARFKGALISGPRFRECNAHPYEIGHGVCRHSRHHPSSVTLHCSRADIEPLGYLLVRKGSLSRLRECRRSNPASAESSLLSFDDVLSPASESDRKTLTSNRGVSREQFSGPRARARHWHGE